MKIGTYIYNVIRWSVMHDISIPRLKVKVAGQNQRLQIGLASKIYVTIKDIEANLVHMFLG